MGVEVHLYALFRATATWLGVMGFLKNCYGFGAAVFTSGLSVSGREL